MLSSETAQPSPALSDQMYSSAEELLSSGLLDVGAPWPQGIHKALPPAHRAGGGAGVYGGWKVSWGTPSMWPWEVIIHARVRFLRVVGVSRPLVLLRVSQIISLVGQARQAWKQDSGALSGVRSRCSCSQQGFNDGASLRRPMCRLTGFPMYWASR